jgi:hypothetical protein
MVALWSAACSTADESPLHIAVFASVVDLPTIPVADAGRDFIDRLANADKAELSVVTAQTGVHPTELLPANDLPVQKRHRIRQLALTFERYLEGDRRPAGSIFSPLPGDCHLAL